MAALNVRLLVSDPDRDDVVRLREALRAGGVSVVRAGAEVPLDFVVVEAAAEPTPESLDGAERRHIRAVLEHTAGNRRQAALLLGIARSTLLAKIRRHGL